MGGGPVSPSVNDKRTYNILVTGFGPFPNGKGGHYDLNASHLIARSLPSHLTLTLCNSDAASNPSASSSHPQHRHGVPGSLHTFPRPNLYPPSAREEHPEDFTDICINIVNACSRSPPSTSNSEQKQEQIDYVRTEYAYTRSFIKKLHDDIDAGRLRFASGNDDEKETTHIKPDLILHLGQASYCNPPSPESQGGQIALERLAFSQSMRCAWWSKREEEEGYHRILDDAGETIKDVDGGLDPWAARDVPVGLGTKVDIDAVVRNVQRARASGSDVGRAREESAGGWQGNRAAMARKEERDGYGVELDVITHHEAGPYLCGFIYYESLAQCYVKKKRADVMFCHVPTRTDEASVARGRDAVCDVLGGVVEWLRERERRGKEKKGSEKKMEVKEEDSAVSAVA